jgi:hypothetical protein
MDTKDLITAIAADARRPGAPIATVWWTAAALAIIVAAVVFQASLGVRPDFAAAIQTPRFLFKFVVTITLAAGAFAIVRSLSQPGVDRRGLLSTLTVAPILLGAAVLVEMLLVPAESWAVKTVGMNNFVCLFYIPMIGLGPLAILTVALRYGAATRPGVAGAVAGLLAGGISATFYAAHCTDDSPLFVIVWYTLAIAILALAGAVAGRLFARW